MKFIFSKFSGFQAYSQHNKQMNSFTGIFQQHFKPPTMICPCPHQILKSPPDPPNGGGGGQNPPMFSTPVGNPFTCVTVFTCAFCRTKVGNLLSGPDTVTCRNQLEVT